MASFEKIAKQALDAVNKGAHVSSLYATALLAKVFESALENKATLAEHKHIQRAFWEDDMLSFFDAILEEKCKQIGLTKADTTTLLNLVHVVDAYYTLREVADETKLLRLIIAVELTESDPVKLSNVSKRVVKTLQNQALVVIKDGIVRLNPFIETELLFDFLDWDTSLMKKYVERTRDTL